jgi:tRNA(Arg) A34 adenosine deaminase TadA
MATHEDFMREAVREAAKAADNGLGKPFGAVVTRDGIIVGRGSNIIFSSGDPTDHAEIRALREACKTLGRASLEDCELHASGQPCLMCLGTAFLLRIPAIYYANSYADAEALGYKGGSGALSMARALGSAQEGFDGNFRDTPAMRIIRLPIPEAQDLYRRWKEAGKSL